MFLTDELSLILFQDTANHSRGKPRGIKPYRLRLIKATMTANAKYKASVFVALLFSDLEPLRELYHVLSGTALPLDMPITINTLQDALFMDRINDVSFEAGGKLVVLIEHQSTINNPNVACLYEKMLAGKECDSQDLV